MRLLVPPGSACTRSFAGFMVVLLEVVKVNGIRVILVFVMYCIYVTSGSSLHIESTDFMINTICCDLLIVYSSIFL